MPSRLSLLSFLHFSAMRFAYYVSKLGIQKMKSCKLVFLDIRTFSCKICLVLACYDSVTLESSHDKKEEEIRNLYLYDFNSGRLSEFHGSCLPICREHVTFME